MQITLNLEDIFCNGEAGESAEDAIRAEIIEKLSRDMRERLYRRLDQQLSETITKQISAVVAEKMPELIDDIMNTTYTPVSSFGQKGEPTNFRNEIIKAVAAQMVYKPSHYSSEENAFTKAVKSIVTAQTEEVKKAIVAQVDTNFQKDAISFAVARLSERLGLTKGK